MAKITYPDKQTAVVPSAPAANEVYTAADANMVKSVVNGLDDSIAGMGGTVNAATSDFTSATLNTAYPTAIIGQKVICPYLSNGPVIYLKITSLVWYSFPIGTIA